MNKDMLNKLNCLNNKIGRLENIISKLKEKIRHEHQLEVPLEKFMCPIILESLIDTLENTKKEFGSL